MEEIGYSPISMGKPDYKMNGLRGYDGGLESNFIDDCCTGDGMCNTGEIINKNEYVRLAAKEYQACASEVMKEYFSYKNIKKIQKKIKREVSNRTRGKVNLKVDQDLNDLNVAMRTVFRMHAKNLPSKIVRQTKILNNITVQYIVPGIMENLEQYYGYIEDITHPIEPIELPQNVNNAGRTTLPSVTQIWNI
jgi:hypothetical protein